MSPRDYAVRVGIALGLVALALFLWRIGPVLMLVFAGIVFATAVRSAAAPLARRLRLPEAASVAAVVVAAVALLGAGAYLFGKQVVDQAGELVQAVEDASDQVQGNLRGTRAGDFALDTLRGAAGSGTVERLTKGTVTAFGVVADIVLVAFLAVYLAADPRTYRDGALRLLPMPARRSVGQALDAAGESLRKWLVGQLGAMVAVGLAIGIALALVGVPLAPALGVVSGLLEFVPFIGPILGMVVGLLIAFAHGPDTALYAALVYIAVLFVEGNVIVPLAQKWAVAMPPALGLAAIVAFGILFGFIGLLFAMPLLVVVSALVQKLYVERLRSP